MEQHYPFSKLNQTLRQSHTLSLCHRQKDFNQNFPPPSHAQRFEGLILDLVLIAKLDFLLEPSLEKALLGTMFFQNLEFQEKIGKRILLSNIHFQLVPFSVLISQDDRVNGVTSGQSPEISSNPYSPSAASHSRWLSRGPSRLEYEMGDDTHWSPNLAVLLPAHIDFSFLIQFTP